MTTGKAKASAPYIPLALARGFTAPFGKNLYRVFVGQPVERWYLQPVALEADALTSQQQLSIRRQSVIGWLQTVLLAVVLAQSLFAGLLRALPAETRSALAFLHRIEWGAYLAIVLVVAQVMAGWTDQVVLTNRFCLLAWRFGKPQIAIGNMARRLQIGYLAFAIVMLAAILWVRFNGFLIQPAR